jgi:hypothetical protein
LLLMRPEPISWPALVRVGPPINVPKPVNWALNIGILGLIVASYVANRQANFAVEKAMGGLLVVGMAATVFYGVLKLRQMQADYDRRCPTKEPK